MSRTIGAELDRVDGRLKVTGAATYAAEFPILGLTYAALVQSTVARGRITRLDTEAADEAPGVLGVLSHLNAPRFKPTTNLNAGGVAFQTVMPLQGQTIHNAGQIVAVVVADTLEQAQYAASLVHVEYDELPPRVELEAHLDDAYPNQPLFGAFLPDYVRGDPRQALSDARARVEHTYTIAIEHHNPMEPHATTAVWTADDRLTVYDTTQGVHMTRQGLADVLQLPLEHIRVICPFVGGGFGAKDSLWPHSVLAAIAARLVKRPVKLVLTRAQMFRCVGFRSRTVQCISMAAQRDGTLTSIVHHSTSTGSAVGEFPEAAPDLTRILYACPNVETRMRLVELNIGVPSTMRAPGEASGSFALESALDELATELELDPIDLRLRNHAEIDPESGLPWSSNGLRACYTEGAERFGWSARNPRPRSMRDGRWLVGWGMATASYPSIGAPAQAAAVIRADGRAVVRSGTADLGTGQYTVMTQVAADALGMDPDRVRFELGDSDQPYAFVAGGSSGARSVGPAVRLAGEKARSQLLQLALNDHGSALYDCPADTIGVEHGEFFVNSAPQRRESFAAILKRHGLDEIRGEGKVDWVSTPNGHRVNAFGAQFVEVRVDPDFGLVRIARALGVFDIGTVLNPKTARSQMIGGITFGIGMALLERTSIHPVLGRVVSPNLAGYLLPVHADVPAIDAFFVEIDDPHVNSLGVKGAGEIGITGVAAAVANAVYHATGTRVRDLPITPEQLLESGRSR